MLLYNKIKSTLIRRPLFYIFCIHLHIFEYILAGRISVGLLLSSRDEKEKKFIPMGWKLLSQRWDGNSSFSDLLFFITFCSFFRSSCKLITVVPIHQYISLRSYDISHLCRTWKRLMFPLRLWEDFYAFFPPSMFSSPTVPPLPPTLPPPSPSQ